MSAQDHTITVLKRTLHSSNLPHMLFYGPPGTGKTSTILALAKELYGPSLSKSRVLELNASDERGIGIVRDKVKNFARAVVSAPSADDEKKYPCPPYKLIILDEADSMTADAQAALRRTMETYSTITRFCLICNYVTRIIDPLASRCSKFRFKPLDESNALSRLTFVADSEKLQYDPEALVRLLETSGGDLRKAITFLQSASRLQLSGAAAGDDDDDAMDVDSSATLTANAIDEISGTVPTASIEGLLKSSQDTPNASKRFVQVKNAVSDLVLSGWSGAQIISQIHDSLLSNDLLSNDQKNEIALALSEADKRLTDGADEHLEVLTTMLKVGQVVN